MSFLSQWTYLLALSLWLGGIVFFSFFTTPSAFIALPKEMASNFISQIFPRYYMLGYFCSGALLLSSLGEAWLVRQIPWIRLFIIVLMLAINLYAGAVLRPQVHQVKVQLQAVEEGSQAQASLQKRFNQGHRLSVILNSSLLLAGLALLSIVAFRLRV